MTKGVPKGYQKHAQPALPPKERLPGISTSVSFTERRANIPKVWRWCSLRSRPPRKRAVAQAEQAVLIRVLNPHAFGDDESGLFDLSNKEGNRKARTVCRVSQSV